MDEDTKTQEEGAAEQGVPAGEEKPAVDETGTGAVADDVPTGGTPAAEDQSSV